MINYHNQIVYHVTFSLNRSFTIATLSSKVVLHLIVNRVIELIENIFQRSFLLLHKWSLEKWAFLLYYSINFYLFYYSRQIRSSVLNSSFLLVMRLYEGRFISLIYTYEQVSSPNDFNLILSWIRMYWNLINFDALSRLKNDLYWLKILILSSMSLKTE